jgi:hypothetical protein
MSAHFDNELAQFNEFVSQRLISGPAISPEEALDLWRAHHPISEELAESVQAVKEALADMEAGDRGMPFDEFIAELRERRNLRARP